MTAGIETIIAADRAAQREIDTVKAQLAERLRTERERLERERETRTAAAKARIDAVAARIDQEGAEPCRRPARDRDRPRSLGLVRDPDGGRAASALRSRGLRSCGS